jgi:glycosyltransferase involved in cell wall biosynthesis
VTRYLIDITRLVSRFGRGKPTGIDRVEIAYLLELVRRDPLCLAVAKMGRNYVLMAAKDVLVGADALQDGSALGRLGLKDFFRLKLPKQQRMARQYFRSKATKTVTDPKALFGPKSLDGIEYVNVGHSNVSDEFMSAVFDAGCSRISVMVHDMIPLDFPQFTKVGMSEQFLSRMKSVARYADRVICNSTDTKSRVEHYFTEWGAAPKYLVAHLGVEPMKAVRNEQATPPYFVCLGTIEPRKNHLLLLQVWDQMATTLPPEIIPHLHIVGRRGWDNEEVFRLLDSSPIMGKYVFELSDLNDTALGTEIAQSSGLLFPSFTEGYGLPALEALQMDVSVICSDIPVFREVLGESATFLRVDDVDGWSETVQCVAQMTKNSPKQPNSASGKRLIPRWESHFCHVFDDTDEKRLIHE